MSSLTNSHTRTSKRFGISDFLHDLYSGLMRWQVWVNFARDDIQQRYKQSILGIFWIILSYLMFVGGITIVFSNFTNSELNEFIIHVAIGYAAFNFIVASLTDGCDVFVRASTWIKSVPLPYSSYVFRSIYRSAYTFSLQMLVAILLMLYIGWRPSFLTFFVAPSLFIYAVNAVGVQYLCGLIAARFRDFTHFITSIARLLFFVTPILWVATDIEGVRKSIATFNPLAHYVEIFRAPLMNENVDPLSWSIVGACTTIIWIVLAAFAIKAHRRLAFWV